MSTEASHGTPARICSQLLADNNDLRDVVLEFVSGLDARIQELRAAHEALDWERLATLAHRLKGAGGSYGYPELSKLGATMERSFKLHCADDFCDWIAQLTSLAAAARAGLDESQTG